MKRQAVEQNMECCYCLTQMIFWMPMKHKPTPPNMATRDHVIPKARNGNNQPPNILVCCQSCNVERSDLPADLFALLKIWQRNGKEEL